MTSIWISRLGKLAIGLVVLGGLVALVNEALSYQRGSALDWGHIALAIGVPAPSAR
ncbi:MAG: hypothetical protein ABI831_05555 [Betaproteobacteria bacterium]